MKVTFREFALSDKSEERQKREKKAASAECTPISISTKDQSGIFSGSSGSYNTWITECTCVDFQRRKVPCKHMYRLAYELGLYALDAVKSDAGKVKHQITPKERSEAYDKCVALIEGYPEKVQRELHSILSSRYGNQLHVCEDISGLEKPLADGLLEIVNSPITIIERNTQKRTVEGLLTAGFSFPSDVKTTKKARYEWCLEHPDIVCSYIYQQCRVMRPAGILEIANKKVYTYLNQKFQKTFGEEELEIILGL